MVQISYLVSVYNDGNYLDRRIRNLLSMMSHDFEIIIIDNNSIDCTQRVGESWAEKDKRIKYHRLSFRENYGNSWLRAWEMAKGKYVCNANCDDLFVPQFHQKMFEAFKNADENVAFAYPGIVVMDVGGRIINSGIKPPFNREEFQRNCLAGPAVVWRRNLINKINLIRAHLAGKQAHSAFDYWLWLYLMYLGYDGLSVPLFLVYYTQRRSSIENSSGYLSTYESLLSIAEFFPKSLYKIAKREGNDVALWFKDYPMVPDAKEFCEAMKNKAKISDKRINIFEVNND